MSYATIARLSFRRFCMNLCDGGVDCDQTETGRGVTATCLTWDQVTPGSNPGAPTEFA